MINTNVNFSQLMDLRVDYAFKLFFATGDTRYLISLLNAIFANKRIPRVITALTILNPYLEKASLEDKLSILDIRAVLIDGSTVCIEMHLYDTDEFKYKSLRSWARIFGEELESGEAYSEQKPVICVSFINGAIKDVNNMPINKVHALFQIMERDDYQILSNVMEHHYINMNAFVGMVHNNNGTENDKFTKWMLLITQKEIEDKTKVKKICEEEEMAMAVEALVKLSKDKIKRQAYQRRLDELHSYNLMLRRSEENQRRAEEDRRRAEEAERQSAEDRRRAEEADRQAAEAERQSAEADRRTAAMVKLLLEQNYSITNIAKTLNVTEQQIADLLQKSDFTA